MIAMQYNEVETKREVVLAKEHKKMIENIKSSIRDVTMEHQSSGEQEDLSSSSLSPMETLQSLARDTPYKRVRKHQKDEQKTGSVEIN